MNVPTNKRGCHLAHLNCQSIKNKLDIIKQPIKDSKFDFFTLSETWLTESYPSELLQITGYNLVRLDRNWSEANLCEPKKGGGIAM